MGLPSLIFAMVASFTSYQFSFQMKFSFPQRYAESYVDALVHFADAVEGKIPGCCITKEETVSAGRIATLAERSWRENKVLQFQ